MSDEDYWRGRQDEKKAVIELISREHGEREKELIELMKNDKERNADNSLVYAKLIGKIELLWALAAKIRYTNFSEKEGLV